MENPGDSTHVGIYLWNGVLTLLFGMLGWNWNKLDARVDDKADKESLKEHKDEIDRRFTEVLGALRDNTMRLNQFLDRTKAP